MASIENIDLSQEIESWKSAVYGKDVRAANVAAFEKIQGTVNDTVQNVNQAAEDSASAAHNAQAAVDSIQAAIVTATEKAAAAATSATQAAGSQEAADSSKTAAAQSATDAITAKTAAEAARDATEHIAGFDGTAASVKATDTYGLVVDALGESTTQDLIDAVANKVINELIAKSNIVNNLLATEVGTVLSGALGPIIDQRLTDLMNKYTQLNGDLYKWLNVTRLDTGNDVNDLPSPSLAYSYSTASHAPFDGISANILTIGIDGYKAQIAFGVSRDSVQVKVRTSYDFVWRGWRSVTLS